MADRRMEALAMSQHGLVTSRQALDCGLTKNGILHRVRRRRLIRVARGVFRLPGAIETERLRGLAAVLAAGDGALLAFASSAALNGLPGFGIEPLIVAVRRNGCRAISGVRLEESLFLPEHHRVVVDGIPCTSVARTLFDLCGDVHALRAERALDTALARKLTSLPELWRVLDELAEHGRAGTVLMRNLLMERQSEFVPPESELEARFIALVSKHGLVTPERQVDLGDEHGWIGRVDFLFRGARLVVEVDGAPFHDSLLDRRHDAGRDARLEAAGWTVLRFRWDDVVNQPAAVARAIRFRSELVAP